MCLPIFEIMIGLRDCIWLIQMQNVEEAVSQECLLLLQGAHVPFSECTQWLTTTCISIISGDLLPSSRLCGHLQMAKISQNKIIINKVLGNYNRKWKINNSIVYSLYLTVASFCLMGTIRLKRSRQYKDALACQSASG